MLRLYPSSSSGLGGNVCFGGGLRVAFAGWLWRLVQAEPGFLDVGMYQGRCWGYLLEKCQA